MPNSYLISVILPVYNGASFLAEAVASILKQTHENLELIIVDDGSTDDSRNIITGYAGKDRRIHPVFTMHRGVTHAMNEGLRNARGQWFARMDQDDVSLPERLAFQLNWALQKKLDICGAQTETFGEKEKMLWFPESHDAVCRELFFRCAILYPAAMIRGDVFRNNLYQKESVFDDYELFTRLAPRYRMGNAPSVLLRHRNHQNQTSNIRQKEIINDFRKYRFRYFYKMFPHTPLDDYLSLALVSDKQPAHDLRQLEKAGQWLIKLSKVDDQRVRQKMEKRWQKTCERSASLGGEVDSIFQRSKDKIRKA